MSLSCGPHPATLNLKPGFFDPPLSRMTTARMAVGEIFVCHALQKKKK
jgi:hypothetical protein